MSAEEEAAIVEWIHTFDVGSGCQSLEQLWDGVLIANILNEIVPESFPTGSITQEVEGKWVLAAKNIRTILRALDEYFTNELGKKVKTGDIDENNVAKHRSADELIKLIELVVGVAVFCTDKQTFISRIFELSADSQAVLKGLVQHVMETAEDLSGDEEGTEDEAAHGVEESALFSASASETVAEEITFAETTKDSHDLLRTREMLQHVTQERQRLLADLQSLESQNDALKSQLQAQRQGAQQQANSSTEDWRQRCESAEARCSQLTHSLEETRTGLDLRTQELQVLQHEHHVALQRWEATKLLQAKAELENRAASDELDLSRAKLDKLAKTELQLEKAQKKLEELLALKKTNKELNDRLDAALDQIHELESSGKETVALQRNLDAQRVRQVENERQLIEAQAQAAALQSDLDRARDDWRRANDKLRQADDEARRLRTQLEALAQSDLVPKAQTTSEADHSSSASTGGGEDEEVLDGVQLRQRVRDLTRDVRQLTRSLETKDQEIQALQLTASSATATASTSAESEALASQRRTSEVLRSTVSRLEDKLKEREVHVARLDSEKHKLEAYAKRSLTAFKEKFMSALTTLREEKRDLEERLRRAQQRGEQDCEAWRREERLLSAALFEVGVKVMDRAIYAGLSTTSATTPSDHTFLQQQREALGRVAVASPDAGSSTVASPAPDPARRLFSPAAV